MVDKKQEEPKAAETLNELIAALQRKTSIEGLPGTTRLQYVILDESGTVVTMKMMSDMAGRVIKVLKTMTKKH